MTGSGYGGTAEFEYNAPWEEPGYSVGTGGGERAAREAGAPEESRAIRAEVACAYL